MESVISVDESHRININENQKKGTPETAVTSPRPDTECYTDGTDDSTAATNFEDEKEVSGKPTITNGDNDCHGNKPWNQMRIIKFQNLLYDVVEELKFRRMINSENEEKLTKMLVDKDDLEKQLENVIRSGEYFETDKKQAIEAVHRQYQEQIQLFNDEKKRNQMFNECSKKEADVLKEELRDLKLNKYSMETLIKEQERNIHLQMTQRERGLQELGNLETKVNQIMQDFNNLKKVQETLQKNVTEALKLNDSLSLVNHQQKCLIKSLENEKLDLQEKILKQTSQRHLGRSEEIIQLDKWKDINLKLDQQLQLEQKTIEKVKEDINSVIADKQKQEKLLQDSQKLVNRLVKTSESKACENTALQSSLASEKVKFAELNSIYEEGVTQISHMKEEHRTATEEWKEQMASLSTEITKLKNHNQTLVETDTKLNQQLTEMSGNKEQLTAQIGQLKKDLIKEKMDAATATDVIKLVDVAVSANIEGETLSPDTADTQTDTDLTVPHTAQSPQSTGSYNIIDEAYTSRSCNQFPSVDNCIKISKSRPTEDKPMSLSLSQPAKLTQEQDNFFTGLPSSQPQSKSSRHAASPYSQFMKTLESLKRPPDKVSNATSVKKAKKELDATTLTESHNQKPIAACLDCRDKPNNDVISPNTLSSTCNNSREIDQHEIHTLSSVSVESQSVSSCLTLASICTMTTSVPERSIGTNPQKMLDAGLVGCFHPKYGLTAKSVSTFAKSVSTLMSGNADRSVESQSDMPSLTTGSAKKVHFDIGEAQLTDDAIDTLSAAEPANTSILITMPTGCVTMATGSSMITSSSHVNIDQSHINQPTQVDEVDKLNPLLSTPSARPNLHGTDQVFLFSDEDEDAKEGGEGDIANQVDRIEIFLAEPRCPK